MTVTTSANSVVHIGNGATTQFAVPFTVLDVAHLVVKRRVLATGVVEYTYIGTDYSYTGLGSSSGTLTLDGPALSSTYELVIERIVPYTQDLDIVNSGGFYPDTVERQLDLMVMGIQQIANVSDRALLAPVGESNLVLPSLSARSNRLLGFDALGDPIAQAVEVTGTAAELVGLAFSALGGADIDAGVTRIQTNGYAAAGDGGAAIYEAMTEVDIFRLGTTGSGTPTRISFMVRTDDIIVGMGVSGPNTTAGTTVTSIQNATAVNISLARAAGEPSSLLKFSGRTLNAAYQALYPQSVFQSADGRWWHLSRDQIIRPEMFGATGDGATDDYAALTALCAFVSNAGGGYVRFGRGKVYFVNQYVTAANGIAPPRFIGMNGFILDGNGATIEFKGNYDRDVSTTTGIGLKIVSAKKVKVFDLNLDGNIEQATNTSGANESANMHGLHIQSVEDGVFENLDIQHFGNDGLNVMYSGEDYATFTAASAGNFRNRASKRLLFSNCSFRLNARQGATVNEAEAIFFLNCRFMDCAQYTGTYGVGGTNGHAPKSGFDFEPIARDLTVNDNLDVDPNNIHFVNCLFENNVGGEWKAALQGKSHTLTFTRCRVVAAANGTNASGIILGIGGCVVRDCYIDLKHTRFEFSGGAGLASHIVEGNEFYGDGSARNLLYAANDSLFTFIRNNRIVHTGTAPASFGILGLTNSKLVFENNVVVIPKAAYVLGAGERHIQAGLSGIRRAANNRYETDLTQTEDGATAAHYYINYGTTTEVENERFVGTVPGTADTIRPAIVAASALAFDTRFRFSTNLPGFEGHNSVVALTDANKTLTEASAMTQRLDVNLTAARTVTLPAPGKIGREFTIVRAAGGGGAFNLNVNTSAAVLVKALTAASTFCTVLDDGTEYRLVANGSL